jgi:carbamoyl-phosphate synthase large subunit
MPKRTDLKTILVLGSGPIVIGQGCEFDYSGTQACKTLKSEGYRIVLVNSNPATIMTDPAFSDRTYIEPILPETVRKIIIREKELGAPIDAILPTLGGQTALNTACALFDNGTLTEFGVEMIGANRKVIHRAEDREQFKQIVEDLGLKMPKSKAVHSMEEALGFLGECGLPAIIRPAFTLGGTGGGIAYNLEEFREIVARGLAASIITQVQIDQSVIGWKEFELEVVRDKKDNCIIVCGIENIDPMGVHTGDSITVAPILTLTDKEYQAMRDAAFAIMRAVGVETGGSNVQFAVNPDPTPDPVTGHKPFEMVVVEMNPRVSRSSALASKATGFPIAKIAARLAVGYTLDELRNDITGTTSACFEPAIDYVVTKIPRWTFEKFPEADETLTTQMKSVGEVMAIGRTFKESFQKALRSLDVKRFGLGLDRNDKWLAAMRAVEHDQLILDISPGAAPGTGSSPTGLRTADGAPIEWPIPLDKLTRKLAVPCQGRMYYIRYAMKMGWSDARIGALTRIDPFFLDQIRELVEFEDVLCNYKKLEDVPAEVLMEAKQLGYSDAQLANLYKGEISPPAILSVRGYRKSLGIEPVYKLVDTCAAEFEAVTPYYYSTYERGIGHQASGVSGGNASGRMSPAEDEIRITDKKKVIILGGGPNRIGQGIEFDYCCVHAAFAAKELGFESVMINSNPETVSTDYDTSDLLFFEPLTMEDVLNIVERLNGRELESGEAAKWQSGEVTSDAGLSHSATASLRHSATSSGLVHGVIVQFGGQTPLNLAKGLVAAGVPLIGTSLDSIDLAEDRKRFDALLERLKINRPPAGTATSLEEAVKIAGGLGYPILVRPSYVLGGRGMEVCPDEKSLRHYITNALKVSDFEGAPVLIDKFLDAATEVDLDVVADWGNAKNADGTVAEPTALVSGLMEHIEHAGVHSGDSACAIPHHSLSRETVEEIKEIGRTLARELKVNGLMNVQLAVRHENVGTSGSGSSGGSVSVGAAGTTRDTIYILEVNPRASRTVPFVSKATHVPWPSIAAKVMMGKTLAELGAREFEPVDWVAVKESVFPFAKFPGVDVVLGPEMRSTGEVMGIDRSFPIAFAKSQLATGVRLPSGGGVFVSVRDVDKQIVIEPVRQLTKMGFTIYATMGTAEPLLAAGVKVQILQKVAAGARPNAIDMMTNGEIKLVINTPTRTGYQTDEGRIRAATVRLGVPMISTASAVGPAVRAIEALKAGDWNVHALQDYVRSDVGAPAAAEPKPRAKTRV